MSIAAILALGFALGMRHATDADHVVAVSAIVSRERTLRAAAVIGILWGVGHTMTILAVGGVMILFGVVISPHVGLALELCVAVMLVLLGGLNIRNVLRADGRRTDQPGHVNQHRHVSSNARFSLRPLVVGVVHGLAGSAAIALLVMGAIRSPAWSAFYLLVFGVGTVAGMFLVTIAVALPLAATAHRFVRLHRSFCVFSGLAGILFGAFLIYRIGFAQGLFTAHPTWTPR